MSSKIVVAIRAHFWDATVERIADRIAASCNAQVVVAADETNGVVAVPDRYQKLAHSAATFQAMGLPLLPTPQRALWFNGDYPLYHLLGELDFDYLMMIEADCEPTGPFGSLLEALTEDAIDLATKDLGPRKSDWPFSNASLKWFGPRFATTQVQGGLFAALFVSRRAVEELRRARLEMAAAIDGDLEAWPYCEAYVPSQLHFSGFRCATLNTYSDVSDMTWNLPFHADEIEASVLPEGTVKFFHPVLSAHKYDQRLRVHHRNQVKLLERLNRHNKRLTARNDALAKERDRLAEALLKKEEVTEERYRKLDKRLKSIAGQKPKSLWAMIKQRLR